MSKMFERVFRTRPLTPEEAVRDQQVRQAVQGEFPPAVSATSSRLESLSETLRHAIRESNQPANEIAEKAHISQLVLSRFLAGERDIHMATADRLAEVLGLKFAVGSATNA